MKNSLRLLTNISLTKALLVPSIAFMANQSIAMPKYNSHGAEVNALQAFMVNEDPILRGTLVIADDSSSVVYVSPSSKKVQTGVFQPVAQPACDILEDHYDLTYLMPNVPPHKYQETAQAGPYSPFFDHKFGNYARQSTLLAQIVSKISQTQQIRDNHRDLVATYEKAKARFEDAQNAFNSAEAAYEELDNNVSKFSLLWLNANSDDARELTRIELERAKQTRTAEQAERKENLRKAINEVYSQQLAYREAKENYDRHIPNQDELKKDIASLTEFFEIIQNLAVQHFTLSERALQAFENTTVGVATASYSIWGEEEARLENALARYGSRSPFLAIASVARLPIHNVRLKKPTNTNLRAQLEGNFNGDTSTKIEQKGMSTDSLLLGDQTKLSNHAIFTKNKQLVTPEIRTISGDGAGTYQNLVTRGTVCTGKSEKQTAKVKAIVKSNGIEVESNFEVPVYASRQTNVLTQSVALEYDFHTRSEPVKVSCSLDISKFRSFIADGGESGFLFWRTSWTNTERSRLDKSGLSCKLKLSPMGEYPNYAEQRQYLDSIRQRMMQEIAAEFILTYAKSWEITHRPLSLPNPGKAAYQAGVALMSLCGANVYCAVGAIVLKTGDELFGAHFDSVSGNDYLSGKIERSYDETAWTTSSGQAIIDLVVTL